MNGILGRVATGKVQCSSGFYISVAMLREKCLFLQIES